MERHITTLVKQNLQDVTAAEFKMFMDFLKSLSLFGHKAPAERIQELVEIIEGQADLDAQFNVSDADHIERFISCLSMTFPFFKRGASGSKFLNYLNKQIMPVFDKLPEQGKLDLLKNLAECSLCATTQDSRQLLPSVVQLLKKYMVRRKIEEINYTCIECLLYTFHHLAHKTPNATNSLCGYKIVTGQPSDRLGEDFSEQYKDFTERLSIVEDLARAMIKKLTQGMADQNKALAAAKTEEEKDAIKTQKLNATFALRACNNILAMTQPLKSKTPKFIGDQKTNLSWKEAAKPSGPSTATVAGHIHCGSALLALEALMANPTIKRGDDQWVDKIYKLMDSVDEYIPIPQRQTELPFLMAIEDVFSITGRGTVATGRVERGTVKTGEIVDIVGLKDTRNTTVTGVEMFQKILDEAMAGDNVGLLLRGIQKIDIQRGMVLAKPGSITPHTKFEALVYVLKKEEGGRHSPFFAGYRPQFYMRTTDVTGKVTAIMTDKGEESKMVMPGDRVNMVVELIMPVACEQGMRFAIREGGKTVGAGVIQKILE